MATKIVIHQGTATGVYDDRLRPLYEALGKLAVERVSEVEYDQATGEWFAVSLETREVIARNRDRGACIAAEIAWLEGRMS